jgi:hypothetical protein
VREPRSLEYDTAFIFDFGGESLRKTIDTHEIARFRIVACRHTTEVEC